MRVAMYYNNRDVRIQEMPVPGISDKELLVKVEACGICGSDVMEWYRLKKAPLVLGHEMAGVIARAGKKVKKYKAGQRVFVSHHVPCNKCRYCKSGNHTVCETLHTTNFFPGGFSEYLRVPAINVEQGVFVLPRAMSFDEATFIEPLACVLRGQRLAQVAPLQTLLVMGAGISGLLHVLAAKAAGVRRIIVTDINEYRLAMARSLGASAALDACQGGIEELLRKENEGRLADAVIVCTGARPAFEQALRCIDRAGVLVCFAPLLPGETLAVPVNDFWRQSIRIVHSYGASPLDLKEALGLIASKKIPVKKLITHSLALEEAQEGFRMVAQAGKCIKVILHPHGK